MFDGELSAEMVKVFQFLDLLGCVACIVTYAPFIVRGMREHPVESRFLVWSVLVAVVLLPSFSSIVYSYVRFGIHPAPAAGLSQGWQLFTLAGLYVAFLGRWVEAEPGRFVVRSAIGVVVSLVVASVVIAGFPID